MIRRLTALVSTLLWRRSFGADSDGINDQIIAHVQVQRDKQLEAVSLQELLQMPLDRDTDLDVRLQRAFVQCRELGVTSLMYTTSIDANTEDAASWHTDDVAYCNRLRYVRHQRQHFRDVYDELAIASQHVERSNKDVDVRAADDVSFQEFFELYAEKTRPLVLQLKEDAKDPVAQLLGLETNDAQDQEADQSMMSKFLSVCFEQETKREQADERIVLRPMRVEDDACTAMLESTFRVPIYMAHDYVQRTNASRADAFLPTIVELRLHKVEIDAPTSAEEIVACPYGLHMLAIPLGDTGSTHVSLFDRKFEPLARFSSMSYQFREIALSADANVAMGTKRPTVVTSDYFQRVPQLYNTFEVRPGRDVLFVPGGILPAMRALTLSSSSGATKVLRFCYCDAANVKGVKQATGLDALLMTSDSKDEAVDALLHALQAQSFDSSFSRRPLASDTTWSSFVTWPRDPAYLTKKNRRQRSSGKDQEREEEEEQLSRRERLKQWQDDKRWERYIASLTLPVAWPPVVMNTTRTTATLRWQELYQPLKHDITRYGYEVIWKRDEHDNSATGASQATVEVGNAMNVTHEQLTRSKMPSTLFGDDFDGRDLEAVVTGLKAETAYSFSVRLVVGEAQGAASGASRRVITSPCASPSRIRGVPEVGSVEGTCLTLRWLNVEDNGGKELELYLISTEKLPQRGEEGDLNTGRGADNGALVRNYERIIAVNASAENDQLSTKVLASGAVWLSTQVCGLFPGASYTFRVAAMNVLGAGLWSHRSRRVEMPLPSRRLTSTESQSSSSTARLPVLKGVGDPEYTVVTGTDILSQSDLSKLIAQDPHRILRTSGAQIQDTSLPRIVLSDVRQEVQVLYTTQREDGMEVEHTFEAWTGHYSPRLFDVSAELVLADPPDASQPLRNAHAVRDRVLLAVRGGVPFVFKLHYAQRAGALGLIIADANGSCSEGFDQRCVPGADKRRGEGFAALDRHVLWSKAHIPCVFLLKEAAQELLEKLVMATEEWLQKNGYIF